MTLDHTNKELIITAMNQEYGTFFYSKLKCEGLTTIDDYAPPAIKTRQSTIDEFEDFALVTLREIITVNTKQVYKILSTIKVMLIDVKVSDGQLFLSSSSLSCKVTLFSANSTQLKYVFKRAAKELIDTSTKYKMWVPEALGSFSRMLTITEEFALEFEQRKIAIAAINEQALFEDIISVTSNQERQVCPAFSRAIHFKNFLTFFSEIYVDENGDVSDPCTIYVQHDDEANEKVGRYCLLQNANLRLSIKMMIPLHTVNFEQSVEATELIE